jgi:hypothetical protein
LPRLPPDRASPRWHDGMRSSEPVSRLTSDVGRILDGRVAVTVSLLPTRSLC